jgi:hypothetical protein
MAHQLLGPGAGERGIMAKPFREWTVLPHGKLTRLDDNLLTVTGFLPMPMGELERRMTIVRISGGRLVVYSAIALDEPTMAELERFGTPAFLVVPNGGHRMDAKIWKARYPDATVVAPGGARDKVERVVHVDTTTVDFGDPVVRFVTVLGTAGREAALVAETDGGTSLIVGDLIFNLPDRPGLEGWLFKKMRMTAPEPHIPPIVRMLTVQDREVLKTQLERWAALPHLKRILVSHGNIVTSDPAAVLRRLAADLVPARPGRPLETPAH